MHCYCITCSNNVLFYPCVLLIGFEVQTLCLIEFYKALFILIL